jgi:hypothetical protein
MSVDTVSDGASQALGSRKREMDHGADSVSSKRTKAALSGELGRVRFPHGSSLQSFLRRCATVAPDVVLTFFESNKNVPQCAAEDAYASDDASGCMFANVPDSTMSCMVVSKLSCVVSLTNGESKCVVCVPLAHLRTCLASAGADLQVEFRIMECGDICVDAFENVPEGHGGSSTYRRTSVLRTLVADCMEYDLDDMEYRDTLEMSKKDIAGLAKCASKLGADTIRFNLSSAPGAGGSDGGEWKKLDIFFQGDMARTTDSFLMYQSCDSGEAVAVNADDAASACPREAPPDCSSDAWVKEYSDAFSAATLSKFVGAMDNESITLRLSPDKPLVMTASLGEPSSWTCFVLASRDEDGDA